MVFYSWRQGSSVCFSIRWIVSELLRSLKPGTSMDNLREISTAFDLILSILTFGSMRSLVHSYCPCWSDILRNLSFSGLFLSCTNVVIRRLFHLLPPCHAAVQKPLLNLLEECITSSEITNLSVGSSNTHHVLIFLIAITVHFSDLQSGLWTCTRQGHFSSSARLLSALVSHNLTCM